MVVVPLPAFIAAKQIPRRSVKGSAPVHVGVDEIAEGGRILFISQRWLSPKGDPPSPDVPELTKYNAVLKAR